MLERCIYKMNKTNPDLLASILDVQDNLVILLNLKGEIIKFNKACEKVTGYSLSEVKNKTIWKALIKNDEITETKEVFSKLKDKNFPIQHKNYLKTKNGDLRLISWTNNVLLDENNEVKYIVATGRDITKKKWKEEKLRYLFYKDRLTDLYNRRFFEEEISRLDTDRQLPISIIMADINGLKIINDSYGHKKGDELLAKTAKILKNSIRKEDILARHGGDEFAILLPKTTKKEAGKIINRIKEKTKITKESSLPVSIGFGKATKEKRYQNIENILKQADNNMYKNKLSESKSAKNRIIQNLLNTLGTKSSETKKHALRMTTYAHDLGEKIGLSYSYLNRLSLLATLHDIGKITISEDILTKPGKLTDEEWEIIKKHPKRGYKIASASEEFAVIAGEILSHHERWDGSGYPQGLKGKEIPYLSRIISIIDAYDVMTSERPYSKAISKKKALTEIKDCAGTQFDPVLAGKFIKLKSDEK